MQGAFGGMAMDFIKCIIPLTLKTKQNKTPGSLTCTALAVGRGLFLCS